MAQTYYARITLPTEGSTPRSVFYGSPIVVRVEADYFQQAVDIIKAMYSNCRIFSGPDTTPIQ